MSGNYFQPIKREFLNLSGGTVTGDTLFTQNLSASTYYSGATPLESIIYNISTGVTAAGNFLPISGGTGGPYEFVGNTTADTIFVSTLVEPQVDNIVDLGTPFKRFRSLNIVNGVAVNFTAETRVSTIELKLGNTIVTEDNIILSGYTLEGGSW
jgi:hypothetical protein